jgi:hypothetical protein
MRLGLQGPKELRLCVFKAWYTGAFKFCSERKLTINDATGIAEGGLSFGIKVGEGIEGAAITATVVLSGPQYYRSSDCGLVGANIC